MGKGRVTKEFILEQAFNLASSEGLESLTIGGLAKHCSMSKSGLFAHFNSKENLQNSVLEFAQFTFQQRVVTPVRDQEFETQQAKIRELLQNWLSWNHSFQGSCMFLDAWRETEESFDSVQQQLKLTMQRWVDYLTLQIEKGKELGEFAADLDAGQAVFELYGAYLSAHLFYALHDNNHSQALFWKSVDGLMARWTNQ